MKLVRSAAVAAILAITALPSTAAVIGISTPGALGANASANLALLGVENFVPVAQGASVTLTGDLTRTVAFSNQNALQTRVDEGGLWGGNFNLGEALLWSGGFDQNFNTVGGGLLTLDFSSAVKAVGAQIQTLGFGAFQTTITAYGAGNVLLGSFTRNDGNSTGDQDGSAIFIGISDSAAGITRVTFDAVPDDPNAPAGFAINQPLVQVPPRGSVPEPVTLLLVGLGLAGGALRRRVSSR